MGGVVRRFAGAALLGAAVSGGVGCGGSRGTELRAPKAMLAEVLFVELDDVVAHDERVHVAGSVANLTSSTVWVDLAEWRLDTAGGETAPDGLPLIHEIPKHGVAYVRVTFSADGENGGILVIGGVQSETGELPEVVGAIPIAKGSLVDKAAARERADDDRTHVRGRDLLDRDCGSGPLVTCPR
jgi:hypothetical protein